MSESFTYLREPHVATHQNEPSEYDNSWTETAIEFLGLKYLVVHYECEVNAPRELVWYINAGCDVCGFPMSDSRCEGHTFTHAGKTHFELQRSCGDIWQWNTGELFKEEFERYLLGIDVEPYDAIVRSNLFQANMADAVSSDSFGFSLLPKWRT